MQENSSYVSWHAFSTRGQVAHNVLLLNQRPVKIENMLRAIQLGVLTKSTKTRLEELEAAKERLELEIAEEKIGKPLLTHKFVHSWVQRFTTKEKQSHHAAAFLSCVVSL
jgi:hypothetical protein